MSKEELIEGLVAIALGLLFLVLPVYLLCTESNKRYREKEEVGLCQTGHTDYHLRVVLGDTILYNWKEDREVNRIEKWTY